jgi:3-hydroxyacyl-[acyl-carrier-protein] dehydratase
MENHRKATVEINKAHAIFEGHFPSLPVVPGVVMMQMVKEVLEDVLNRKLQLTSAGNLKFLSLINPLEAAIVAIEVIYKKEEDNTISLEGNISVDNKPYFKMAKACYK